MSLRVILETIGASSQALVEAIQASQATAPLGLRRSARLPVLAALQQTLQRPALLITDRADHALTLMEELSLWAPEILRMPFPEPTPLFYEDAAWGESTRRDRLAALTALATYHIPGAPQPERPPLLVAPARALMTRTLPRRDFLKASRTLRLGQILALEELARTCVKLG
jgi:transcription-repair coupling factor (superfamily II helicase)